MSQSSTRVIDGEVLPALPETASTDASVVTRAVPWLAVLIVAAWASFLVGTGSGQWGDHFEQFVWAHGLQWGYHKHPPLPTWLLAALTDAIGPAVWSAEVLAIACTLGTAFFTYRIAQMLIGNAAATLALLLWGLQHAFSSRVVLFNHNTVLMLMTSVTAWALLQALRNDRRAPLWWLATGVAAGLSLLAKYQALVPLTGLLVAMLLSGDLATRPARRGLLLAAATALLVVMPHLIWVLDDHFAALAYATQQGQSMNSSERAMNVASFLAQQLRMLFPALLLCGLLLMLGLRRGRAPQAEDRQLAWRRSWLFGLIGLPLALTVLTAPLFGMHLQNHWGYQATQFASLWLAWRVRPRVPAAGASWIVATLLAHAAFLSAAALSQAPEVNGKRHDRHYPAQALADAVRQDWRNDSMCPLGIVVGPSFEAGIVSVYNGGQSKVLEDGDFAKSPWISPADLERSGAVYVATELAELPSEGVTTVGSFDAPRLSADAENRVYWAIVPPQTCALDP
jgi:4-amino-4-deoxy-L-arabinose transferase-like glycosyltransferase